MKNKRIIGILIASMLLFTGTSIPILHATYKIQYDLENNKDNQINEKKVTVLFRQYNEETNTVENIPIKNVSKSEAYTIRDALVNIQDVYSSSLDRISAQIQLLREYELIPDDFGINQLVEKLPVSIKQNNIQPSILQQSTVTPNVIVCGPCITSFMALGGPLLPLHNLLFGILPPFWYNTSDYEYDFFTGTRVETFIGLLPLLGFYCSTTSIINAYGAVIGEQSVVSPFIALMVLHAGFGLSMIIYDDAFPVNIFDWSIGVSATGLIAYVQLT